MSTETRILPDEETVARTVNVALREAWRDDYSIQSVVDAVTRPVLALLAPRVIEPGPNQAAELDALPAETVLRWSDGDHLPAVIEKGHAGQWWETAYEGSRSVSAVVAYNVPWTVLYLPA